MGTSPPRAPPWGAQGRPEGSTRSATRAALVGSEGAGAPQPDLCAKREHGASRPWPRPIVLLPRETRVRNIAPRRPSTTPTPRATPPPLALLPAGPVPPAPQSLVEAQRIEGAGRRSVTERPRYSGRIPRANEHRAAHEGRLQGGGGGAARINKPKLGARA